MPPSYGRWALSALEALAGPPAGQRHLTATRWDLSLAEHDDDFSLRVVAGQHACAYVAGRVRNEKHLAACARLGALSPILDDRRGDQQNPAAVLLISVPATSGQAWPVLIDRFTAQRKCFLDGCGKGHTKAYRGTTFGGPTLRPGAYRFRPRRS